MTEALAIIALIAVLSYLYIASYDRGYEAGRRAGRQEAEYRELPY